MSLGHEQFRMRPQGILTGLVDFRDVQESAADELEPESWLDMPPVSTNSWEYEEVTPRATKRIGDARFQEIRLSHERLRTYLRKNKLIDSWLDSSLLVTFPNHLWFDIYSDILIASNKVSDQWSILKEAMKASASFDQKHHLRVQTMYDGILERLMSNGFLSFEKCLPTKSCGYLLLEAVSSLVMAAKEIKNLDVVINNVSRALQSSLVLLDDFIKSHSASHPVSRELTYKDLRHGMRGLAEHDSWSIDLAYAASRRWSDYLFFHKARLAKLSDREWNFILRCCFLALVVDLRPKSWVFSLNEEQERIVNLLLEHEETRSPHVAIDLESVAHVEPPQYLQQCPAGRGRSASAAACDHGYLRVVAFLEARRNSFAGDLGKVTRDVRTAICYQVQLPYQYWYRYSQLPP